MQTGTAFTQNIQVDLNVDTGRAGLWSGGLFHFALQGRYGSDFNTTFRAGGYAPQFNGFVAPGATYTHDFLASEYYYVQALGKQFNLIAGKISDLYIPDQTLFADSYKYYFANFNLNENPMTTNDYNPTAWAFLAAYAVTPKLVFAGGVLDPFSRSTNFAKDAFDRVNIYFTAINTYDIHGLPGQFVPSFNYSNQAKINLDNPYGNSLQPAQVPQAIGSLLGIASSKGLPVNIKNNTGFLIANIAQYVYVQDKAADITGLLKAALPLHGVGIFARGGYATEQTSILTYDGDVGAFARGIIPTRANDSFGVGFYYDGVSSDLKSSLRRLSAGTVAAHDEKGLEVFYDFALTPAIRLIASYQHLWNPLDAEVAVGHKDTDIILLRSTINW